MSKFTRNLKEVIEKNNNNKVYFDCCDWTDEEKAALQKALFEEGFNWHNGSTKVQHLSHDSYGIDRVSFGYGDNNTHEDSGYTKINHLYKPNNITKGVSHMTNSKKHPKSPLTTRVTVFYKEGAEHTFSNCSEIVINSECISGKSNTTYINDGTTVTSEHNFTIQLLELNGIKIRGKEGMMSNTILINDNGKVTHVTDETAKCDATSPRAFVFK